MQINQTKIVPVEAKELRIHIKICDSFAAWIYDDEGKKLGGQDDGYVPGFMPGDHYGDYLILNIDLESGWITNWIMPTVAQVEGFIRGVSDDE